MGEPKFHFKKSPESSNNSEYDFGYCSNRKHLNSETRKESSPDDEMYKNIEEVLIDQKIIDVHPDEDMLALSMSDSNNVGNTEAEHRTAKKRKCASNKRKNNHNHELLLEKRIMLALDAITQDKDVEVFPPDVKHFMNLIGSQLTTVTEMNKRMQIMLKISTVLSEEFQK